MSEGAGAGAEQCSWALHVQGPNSVPESTTGEQNVTDLEDRI